MQHLSCIFRIAIWSSCWSLFLAQSMNRYVYSYMSCSDLIPRHSSGIIATTTTSSTTSTTTVSSQLLNGTRSTTSSGGILFPDQLNSTNSRRSSTGITTSPPSNIQRSRRQVRPVQPAVASLNVDVSITTVNGNLYAPGRTTEVMISFSTPLEGFMAQVVWSKDQVVGTFFDPPPYTELIDCPLLSRNRNTTILDDDTPILLNNISLKWRAPPKNLGRLTFKLSVLARNQYKIVGKDLYPSSLPPENTNSCGIEQICFRICPDSAPMCPFAQAHFVAIIRPAQNNRSALITIGFKSALMNNYGAVGFTKDDKALTDMDMNACYYTEENDSSKISVSHLFLKDKEAAPMPHQGRLNINNFYMDGDTKWCDFSRPLIGNGPTSLNLENPMYMFFFTGHHTKKGFEIPKLNEMMKTRKMVRRGEGMPLNFITYLPSNARTSKQNPHFVLLIFMVYTIKYYY